MLTAAHARYLTQVKGSNRRFVDFAISAYELGREEHSSGEGVQAAPWATHLADTGFESPDEFHAVAAEILLARSVDAFQYYLVDIISWALWRQPTVAGLRQEAEALASESGIDLDDTTKQVAALQAERVSFGGFDAMVQFIEGTFGVSLILEEETRARLRLIIATRNMIAHNRSIKNARFCRSVGEPASNVGQSVRPTLPMAREAEETLTSFVKFVDDLLRGTVANFPGP